jgi:hypothetical protein
MWHIARSLLIICNEIMQEFIFCLVYRPPYNSIKISVRNEVTNFKMI